MKAPGVLALANVEKPKLVLRPSTSPMWGADNFSEFDHRQKD